MSAGETPRLGLLANASQFWLLVAVNAFVGAMVGLERTVLPLLAEAEFGLASRTAVLSFVATFGIAKATANFLAGRLGDRYGRKPVLVAGWLFGVPVPFMIMLAPTWGWVIGANVLLGINQGLAWSTTVVMKIDLVGPARRGLAMGLNEFAGYLAVAVAAVATGWIASAYGLRPEPFYLGIGIVALGLGLSVLSVQETRGHAVVEAKALGTDGHPPLTGNEIFRRTTWSDPALSSASQAGMINNLNDGVAWGLFPLWFAQAGLDIGQIGVLAFVYPATWGVLQLPVGWLSDYWGRKWLIAAGMGVQAAALAWVATLSGFWQWAAGSALLGLGTAMVYPTLLAAVTDVADPGWRGSAVGIYRLWRDGGYAAGALVAGLVADSLGVAGAFHVVAGLTLLSGLVVALRMPETRPAS